MRRNTLATLAFTVMIVIAGASVTRAQTTPAQARPAPAAADQSFYFAVARSNMLDAPADADVQWTRGGRSGTIRLGAKRVDQSGAYDCREFFVREMLPAPKPPVTGAVCVTDPSVAATSNGPAPTPLARADEDGNRFDLRRIEYAVAAGAGGAPRGITIPPQRPSPPPPAPVTVPAPQPGGPPAPPRNGQINVKPVLVQINGQTSRENQNGGHAVVLLRDTPAVRARNLATCEAMLRHFDDAPISEVRIGVRREADGSISALRPIYWPVNARITVVGDRCAQRLQRYDFARATTIRDKLRIPGDGPYLVVSRSDERLAATIDLSGLSNADIEKAVVYFRDGISQRGDAWNPQSFTRQRQEQSLIASFGVNFPRVLLAAVRFYAPLSAARAGQAVPPCLGDLSDTRRC